MPVDRILQNPIACLGAIGETLDEIVEGPLHVEHHRREVSLLGYLESRQSRPGDGLGLIAQRAKAQRVRKAPGRVDRQHQDAATAPRRLDADGGGDGGLAHAAAPHAHRDARLQERPVRELRSAHAAAARGIRISASARTVSDSGCSIPSNR